MPEIHARLRRVVVLNDDALDVIESQDGPHTLFYLDPPYHPDTRSVPGVYRHEAPLQQHRWLLEYLTQIRGKAVLSGYDDPMYDEWLHDWHRVEFDLPNNAAGGDQKRRMTEVAWRNYQPVAT
jgi:DNA adenine methylase